ncbi:NAD(P)-dependent oxidoreductase [Bacillus sp. RG28]|uniref:NAD(P)-dependent oxidoreductase n=1 Tax=Gottfriedia endophytica TaxID=2820819 RepID=A0A940SJY9_9BACI|nr:NAD(P)-dependent oxidoreductase [Gottfriedia endophytica]MBP0724713.1 NAD(P)-dependent oxidoreductase [Gottfriedia endophytica]
MFELKGSNIGFIGIGVMGKSMAKHLMNAGANLHIYNRTKEKAEELIEMGASWYNTPSELAPNCEVIITMVGFPYDLEEVFFNETGLLTTAKEGTIFIDFTTSTPSLAKKIDQITKEKGMYSLDAPVSGGDLGAREAKLAIMVGGDEEIFQKMSTIFNKLGQNIVYHGVAGSGQHVKMCNQIGIAGSMFGVCEALAYAKKAGLNGEKVLSSISTGAAGSWSLTNLAPRILKGDFEPGFYIKHFIKDMKIALDEAKKMELELPGLSLAKECYELLANKGLDEKGTQALYMMYDPSHHME